MFAALARIASSGKSLFEGAGFLAAMDRETRAPIKSRKSELTTSSAIEFSDLALKLLNLRLSLRGFYLHAKLCRNSDKAAQELQKIHLLFLFSASEKDDLSSSDRVYIRAMLSLPGEGDKDHRVRILQPRECIIHVIEARLVSLTDSRINMSVLWRQNDLFITVKIKSVNCLRLK